MIMNFYIWILIALSIILVSMVIIPRIRMERRAKALLREIPNHECKTIYIKLSSLSAKGKKGEMDHKTSEMAKDGWLFLKASEASPLKTLLSMGGGLNMHFIRDASGVERAR